MNERYAVVDIETTGGMYRRDKITEIGIVLMEGTKIIDTFETLINPERSIPEFITRITGIDDKLVESAPRFFEVAKDIVEWTDGALFVAHNVDFDYRFIRHEFAELGYTFTRKKLCTIKLAKRYFPGLKSYSLGNLIKEFSIEVGRRHRALDDALASADILKRVLVHEEGKASVKHFLKSEIAATRLPDSITAEQIHNFPEDCGLYYFYDRFGQSLYIGKSINIKKRIIQHFAGNHQKAADLRNRTQDIRFDLTGSELIALLRESEEIKKHLPIINRAQRTRQYPYVVYTEENENGYLEYKLEKWSKNQKNSQAYLNEYGSLKSARGHVVSVMTELNLCPCLTNFGNKKGSCHNHQLELCEGAGIGLEESESYNERHRTSQFELDNFFPFDFVLVDNGRQASERSLICVSGGTYYGYGYLEKDDPITSFEDFFHHISQKPSNPETNRIILRYLYEGKYQELFKRESFNPHPC